MPSDDRERSFENALASHVRASSSAGVPGNPCADSEMLAAYHQGSLPPEQVSSLKTHVTNCSRCQEILGFLEATDQIPISVPDVAADVPQVAVAAPKSNVHVLAARKPTSWRWIAPAGALAAALLVWVAIQENNSVRVAKQGSRGDLTQPQIAKEQPPAPPPLARQSFEASEKKEAPSPDAFSPSDAAPPLSQIAPAPRQRQGSLAKEKDSLNARKEATPGASVRGLIGGLAGASPKNMTPPASEQDRKSLAPGAVTQTVTAEAASPDVTKTDAAQSALAQTELETKSANDKRAAVSRSTPSAPAFAGAAPAPGPIPEPSPEPSQLNTESAGIPNLPSQQREVTNLTSVTGTAALRLANTISVSGVTVSAPGGRVSWRIGRAGVVEFSSDAGKSWILQPSGIIADLLAGSAPSPKVCWIVGRSGTILRTTDGGKHWRKVNPPTQDDLRSVFAVDARQATVSPANASYQTTDGGATWNKLPPE
jgi:Photosynthesis system II assembly factor YCF48